MTRSTSTFKLDVSGGSPSQARLKSQSRVHPTLADHESLVGKGNGNVCSEPKKLEMDELAAFRECHERNLRLEQERIPQSYVDNTLPGICEVR